MKTVIDFNGYDIQTGMQRVITIAHPLLKTDKTFNGAIVWEID